MSSVEEYACLGISILGGCLYNPAHPNGIYLSIGNAISALGFILAIQQLLKPIYQFRLKAYGIKLRYLLYPIFIGFFCSVIAAILPSLPIQRTSPLGYPIFWEVIGGLFIVASYALTAFISLRPAHLFNFNLVFFVRAAADLLSKAEDADRVSFAEDLSRNIEKLINYTKAWERAEHNATRLKFEALKEAGLPASFQGRPPMCPFYAFAHREELRRASYAGTFLRIISDPHFCSALVRKCPWLIAKTIGLLSEKKLHVDQANSFVQEIGHQAILHEESIVAREIGYDGFGNVPILSESLFADWFILHYYNPLGKLSYEDAQKPTEGYISRLNGASKLIIETALKEKEYWAQGGYVYSVEQAYEHLCSQLSFRRYKGESIDFHTELHHGIASIYKVTLKALESLDERRRKSLFIANTEEHRSDLVHTIASIVYESLASISNKFQGYDDECWHHAISVFHDIYPFHENEPIGLDPLQQQLALQLVDKLKDNMNGWYPAITRVLLAVIGPYEQPADAKTKTAYRLIKDAVYIELKKLPELQGKNPDKVSDYLPPNVSYDATNNTLAHTYSGGEIKITKLSELIIPEVNLLDESNWRYDSAGETT